MTVQEFEARGFETRGSCEMYFLRHVSTGYRWYPGLARLERAKKAREGIGIALLTDLLQSGGGYWEDEAARLVPAVDCS